MVTDVAVGVVVTDVVSLLITGRSCNGLMELLLLLWLSSAKL